MGKPKPNLNKGEPFKNSSFKPKNKQKLQQVKKKNEDRKMLRQQKAADAYAARKKACEEKDLRIKAYKKKRLLKTKAISKRTKRGQPVMKDRMQLLLQQIQAQKRC